MANTGGDDPLDALAAEAKAAARGLEELARRAQAAQDPLRKAGEGAEQAAEGAGKASRAADVWTQALGKLAADGLERAAGALADFVGDLPEAAARSESHAHALGLLGGAYAEVQRATNGAVSAEQAAGVQQRALQAGLRLSAQELAAVTSRAREFARATGGDVNQALDQLTDQLIQPGEELAKFGVRLQTGMAAGDAMREALRQLTTQTGEMGVSQVSLAESMEMATRAQREASDALAGMVAQRLELRDFFTQLTSWINDSRDATDGWKVATDAVVGTLREAVGLRAQIGTAGGAQSASGQFTSDAGAIAGRLRGRGMNLAGFQFGEFGMRANEAQRNGALAALRQADAGGMTREQLLTQLSTLDANARETAARAGADVADAAVEAAAARAAEIARRNRASTSRSAPAATPTPTNNDAQWFVRRDDSAGLQSFLGALSQRDIASQQAARGGSVAQQLAGIELQRQSSQATAALDTAGASRSGFMGGALSRSAGEAETRQRTERVRILREQREALASLLTESQREEDIARRMGRPVSEVNELIQQRISIQTALAQSTRDLVASQEEQASGFSVVGEKLIGTLEGTADAFGESVVAALEGSKSFGESMEEMVRATLRALAKLAIVEALKEGAMAIAAAATYRYDAAIQHGISAGMWVGVGVAAGAGVAAMGAPKTSGGAGAGAGGAATRSADTGRSARVDEKAAGGPLNLVINVSGAAFTDAGVQQAVSASIRDAVGNGYLTRTQLAGLLGGD